MLNWNLFWWVAAVRWNPFWALCSHVQQSLWKCSWLGVINSVREIVQPLIMLISILCQLDVFIPEETLMSATVVFIRTGCSFFPLFKLHSIRNKRQSVKSKVQERSGVIPPLTRGGRPRATSKLYYIIFAVQRRPFNHYRKALYHSSFFKNTNCKMRFWHPRFLLPYHL